MDPLATLMKLSDALDERAKAVADADAWYSGNHPLPEPPANTAAASDAESRLAFQTMARLAVTNFLPAVVDVPAARLNNEGFHFSQSPASTDTEAWDIWKRNHLDGDSDLMQAAALRCGSASMIVWPGPDGKAEITVEDPAQVLVAYEPGSRRKRSAALKRWLNDDGRTYATLYTPSWIYKYQTATRSSSALILPTFGRTTWEQRQVPGESWPLPNPLGVVPVVELRANPPLAASPFGGGVPEFAGQINEQRKINQTVMNMLVTMEHQAFRQRWATDWDYPLDADGRPDKAAMLKASASRLMVFNNEDATTPKVGEFAQADFRPFLEATEFWVNTISTGSGTPPYAFTLGNMMNVAADMMARIEGVQSDKLKVHSRNFAEGESEAMRLALAIEGNPKAADPIISVVWGEFDRRTATEQANLAQIASNLGAPKASVFAMFPGVDQAEANRWAVGAIADDLRAAALTPTVAAPAPPAVEAPVAG